MSLFIHLGVHKTATTHLQKSVKRIEPELLKKDFMFLGPDEMRRQPLSVVNLLNHVATRDQSKRVRSVRRILRGLVETYSDCLVSEELLLGGLNPRYFLGEKGRVYTMAEMRMKNLLYLFDTTNVTLFLALRSPASFLTSVFGESLRYGGPLTPGEYFGNFELTALRWSDLVTRIMRSGAQRMVCWRFEDLADVRHAVLTRMLGEEFAPMIPDLQPIRPGLTQMAYDKIIANAVGLPLIEQRKLVNETMRQFPKAAGAEPLSIFDDELRQKYDQNYAEDCARVAEIPGVEFLTPAGLKPRDEVEGCNGRGV